MRIISQDGMIDVPYEQVSIEQRENEIWCGYSSTMEKHCIGKLFATYSTNEKAKEAVELLRYIYVGNEMYKVMSETQRAAFVTITNEKQQEQICGIFRFPK